MSHETASQRFDRLQAEADRVRKLRDREHPLSRAHMAYEMRLFAIFTAQASSPSRPRATG